MSYECGGRGGRDGQWMSEMLSVLGYFSQVAAGVE